MNFARISISFVASVLFCFNCFAQYRSFEELPNMHVNDIFQDSSSFIWISTDYGLYKFNGTDYFSYYHVKSDPTSLPSNKVVCTKCDCKDNLWVLTKSGLCILDPIINSFETVLENVGIDGMICIGEDILCYGDNEFIRISTKDNSISTIQSQDRILLARNMSHDKVAIAFDSDGGSYVSICNSESLMPISTIDLQDSSKILSLVDDGMGLMWIGTDNGLKLYDLLNCAFVDYPEMGFLDGHSISVLIPSGTDMYVCARGADIHLWKRTEREFSNNLARKRVFNLNYTSDFSCGLSDGEGLVWVGTYDRGYAFRSEQDIAFVNNSAILRTTVGKYFNSSTVSPDGIFWLASKYKGIIAINDKSHSSIWYNYADSNLPLTAIEYIFCDSQGRMWLSSENEVSVSKTDGFSFNTISSFTVPGNVSAFCEDSEMNVWAATSNGIFRLSPTGVQQSLLSGNPVSDLILSDTRLLAAVDNVGIIEIDNGSSSDILTNPFFHKVNDLAIAPDGKLWIGTSEDGLYVINEDGVKTYTISDGLLCNEIQSIVFDKKGNAWIGTSLGLSLITKNSNLAVTYTRKSTLPVCQFTPRAAVSIGNTICIAGVSGLALFSSSRIISRISDRPVKLNLSSIKSNGVVLTDLKPDGVAKLNDRQKIVLPHKNRSIMIDYEAVEYLQPENITFAYRLVGLEDEWNYVTNLKSANYSNLPHGHYVFELIARNPDGYWNECPKTLDIVVRPSPFLAWYSIIIYLILLVCAVWSISSFFINKKFQAEKLEMTLAELENEKKVTGMKVDFFTNISHELRTALSLIYGPVSTLRNLDNDNRDKTISFINQNIRQLIVLVDQLLNLSRIENGSLPLLVSKADVNLHLKRIISSFSALSERKHILITMDSQIPDNTHVLLDTDKFQKILGNLFSNAIKYGKIGGNVIVKASIVDNILDISVMDDGIGMSKDDAKYIFERYRRLHRVEKSSVGTGIGLHFVKQLALLHKGDVTATVRDTGGMIFTVSLPVSADAYSEDEICLDTPEIIDGFIDMEYSNEISMNCDSDMDESKPLVAVIEDNHQLGEYLKSILSDYYRVIVASGAEQGLELLESEMPDIVTTDVMMDGMDGYEFCRTIKDNPLFSHIPVVMLTAKVTDEDKIVGFKNKANAYITKPFNPELLLTVIRNLLEEREKLRHSLLNPEKMSEHESIMSQHDAEFISKLNSIIDEKISEPAVSVNELCGILCVGRSSLFRKMKALTGVSPNEYIIVYKLNKSIVLLKEGSMNISEIGYYLGFSSPSHFTKAFKEHFGKTPREYLL